MNKRFIIAIDEGTSSTRAVLFDVEKNNIVQVEQQKFSQYYPHPGWVEHDAEEIWKKTKECLDKLILKVRPENVFGIGITNQRETTIVWNKKTGKPINKAIVWQCRRTAEFCKKELVGNIAQTIHKKTGLVPDPYFSATKLKWILDNNEKAKTLQKQNNLCFGTIDSFLVFKLTDGKSFVTDITNASRTMLFNIKTQKWDPWLLKLFNINKNILPTVVENDKIVGEYDFCGTKIPVGGIAGDQQSSLFGQCCFKKGDIKNTYGTGSFLLLNTGATPVFSKNKLLSTIAWKINGKTSYALEGSVFSCGTSVDWLKRIGFIEKSSDCDDIAEQTPSSNGVFFVPAFTGLGAPYWDPKSRAMVFGISADTTKEHICRAVLESIAFSVKDIFKIFEKDSKVNKKVLKVDGGVSKSSFVMQFQSDLLGLKVQTSKESESTSMGAIFLCGLATGAFKTLKDIEAIYEPRKTFRPKMKKSRAEKEFANWKNIVQKVLTKKGE